MTQEEMWLLEEKYGGEKTAAFFADCERLREGKPLAYIIGHVPFLNTIISLDSRPLIPRPETEFWTSAIIELMKEKKPLTVLDLCAGSGCIGVSILKALPHAHVDFAELEEIHHPTIQKNILANGIGVNRTTIFGGDLFEQITGRYDVIVSNPPYIDPALDRTSESVKAYEPHQALYGGENGIELIVRILEEATAHLTQNGVLVIEHEPEQQGTIEAESARMGYLPHTHMDQYGVSRYTVFTREDRGNMAP